MVLQKIITRYLTILHFTYGRYQGPDEYQYSSYSLGKEEHGWEAQNRYLNVSDISVNITDFNGARITFSSNMPVVKVLPDVIVAGSKTMKTEKVFNDLILAAGENSTTRFAYTYDVIRGEGTGYMIFYWMSTTWTWRLLW